MIPMVFPFHLQGDVVHGQVDLLRLKLPEEGSVEEGALEGEVSVLVGVLAVGFDNMAQRESLLFSCHTCSGKVSLTRSKK